MSQGGEMSPWQCPGCKTWYAEWVNKCECQKAAPLTTINPINARLNLPRSTCSNQVAHPGHHWGGPEDSALWCPGRTYDQT